MSKRPSERRIGTRIKVKAEHETSVAGIFAAAAFTPLYIDRCAGGSVSFWFDKPTSGNAAFVDAVRSVPLEHWAHYAIIGAATFH